MNSRCIKRNVSVALAVALACSGAQAILVTGSGSSDWNLKFQNVSAKDLNDAGYNVGTGVNNLKVYTNTWIDPAGLTFGTLHSFDAAKTNPAAITNKLTSSYVGTANTTTPTNTDARDYLFNVLLGGSVSADTTKDRPWDGHIFDLGGQANKAVVFPIRDHGPDPEESLEYTVYLTNNPSSQLLSNWQLANLDSIYLEGWEIDSIALADGFTTVWTLPTGATFRYVSIQAMGSGAFGYGKNRDQKPANGDDAELDAVAGLTAAGQPVTSVPEPSSTLLVAAAVSALAMCRQRQEKKP